MSKRVPAIERAWPKVVKSEGCWLWTGHLDRLGYGRMWKGDGTLIGAHVVVYEAVVGPVPEGLELDHRCRNHACVRPEHLEPVTHRTNVLRGTAPTAINAAKTHCTEGHPLEGRNLRIESYGSRRCRECANAANRRYRAKKKVAA